jgi:peptidyl-prolyl cis-trans isomerase C
MNKSVLSIVFLPLLLILQAVFSGCGGEGGLVLADVGGDRIVARDLNEIFDRNQQIFDNFEDEFNVRKDILDSLVIQQLLIQEAYRRNIDESEEVNRIVLANRNKFLLDVLYQRMVGDKIEISEDEIKDFYDKLEDKIQASHILVADQDSAVMILDSLRAGSNFENLAVKYSIDPSAQRNRGDLGYFVWGQMDPIFQEQVFKMNPGEISEPFKTRYGWHIVKMADRSPNDLRGPYGKAYDQIRRSLENVKRNELLEEYKGQLEQKYIIRVDTVTCEYLMHKRASLYPPSLLETLPKNDFDINQLDRDEKELILATWEGGQITVGQYLIQARRYGSRAAPNFDDYDGLANFIFGMNFRPILEVEARNLGLEDDPEYKRKTRKFKELAMADIMENDSLPYPGEPDEGEIRQYYEDHQDEFKNPPKIHLYEILFNDHNTAKTYAQKIKSLDKFKSVASQYTERSGKRASGGDLGYIDKNTYPRLYATARVTEVGKVTGPIPWGEKFSIIYVADKKPEDVKDFLMVKQEIKDKLDKQRRQEGFEEWVKQKKEEVDIKIHENNIRAGINKAKYESSEPSTG